MITLADLRPGDIMFGPIKGIIPGAFPVGAGQILLANRRARLTWREWWKVRHVGVVVEVQPGLVPLNGDTLNALPIVKLVQAMPRGAEEIELTPATHWTPDYVYIRPAWRGSVIGNRDDFERLAKYLEAGPTLVAQAARGYLGTPYNFLTYGKLAAGVLRMRATEELLRRWISSRHDMMCSQLVDQALTDAGFHVFNDGRLPQDVVPAELFRRLLELPGQYVIPNDDPWNNWRDNSTW